MTQQQLLNDICLSKNENLALRGFCIMFIVLHNLAHNVMPFEENEKWFNPEFANFFINNFFDHPILGSISYLGWLGVPIFFFLSGYGLSKKYGHSIQNTFSFITGHYLKLLLLAGPFILLKNIKIGTPPLQVLAQLTFLNNLFENSSIYPAAFWYLRVAFEYYILYALILRRFPVKWLLVFAMLVTCSLFFLNDEVVKTMKYHSIGWLLDFSLGVYVAQHGQWLKRIENVYCSFLFFVMLVFSSINEYAWYFSCTFAVLFFLSIKRHLANRLMTFLGSISAFLYVIHPLIRDMWLHLKLDYMNGNLLHISLSVCTYFLLCVLVAYLYGLFYKRILVFIQGCFQRIYR